MSIAVGQSTKYAGFDAGPKSVPTALNTNASGSTFVFLFVCTGTLPTAAQISDTVGGVATGNTYSQVGTNFTGFGGGNAAIFYCQNGAGGTNHVFTATWTGAGAQQIMMMPVEITGGALTGILDQTSSSMWNDDTSSPFTANAITPAQAAELVLAFCISVSSSGTEVPTFGSGFSTVQYQGDANSITGGIAGQVISSISSLNISYTLAGAGSTEAATALISFKAAAGGDGGSVWVDAPNSPRPGRGPFSKNRFRVSDTTSYTSSGIRLLSGISALVFGQSGTLIQPSIPFLEEPNRPRPGRGPFSKGRFYVSDTTPFTSGGTLFASGTSALVLGQSGVINAAGALAANSALIFGQIAALAGAGALTGSSALLFGQTGTLTQPGLVGSAAITFGQNGLLTGTGVLAAASALQFGQTAALIGAGALAGASALVFGQTGNAIAVGTLAGTTALLFAQTAALAGSGALTGTSALAFGASGTADLPPGAMVGTSALSFGQSSTLTAFGALIGNCQIVISASEFVPSLSTQPGALDSPQIAEGQYRRRKKRAKKRREDREFLEPAQPVFIAPASLEHEIKPVVQDVERASLAQLAAVELLRHELDDEEAMEWILKVLD